MKKYKKLAPIFAGILLGSLAMPYWSGSMAYGEAHAKPDDAANVTPCSSQTPYTSKTPGVCNFVTSSVMCPAEYSDPVSYTGRQCSPAGKQTDKITVAKSLLCKPTNEDLCCEQPETPTACEEQFFIHCTDSSDEMPCTKPARKDEYVNKTVKKCDTFPEPKTGTSGKTLLAKLKECPQEEGN